MTAVWCGNTMEFMKGCLKNSWTLSNALSIEADSFEECVRDHAIQSKEIYQDVEILFRSLLHELYSSTDSATETIRLIEYAMNFAKKNASINVVLLKIPFVLLEDYFEAQSILSAEAMWPKIEKILGQLSSEDFFQKGYLIVLKLCNSLLRRLSKSCNTEFCGKILLTLSAMFPVSEKSALNLTGKINANAVTFESQEEFDCCRDACAVDFSKQASGAATEQVLSVDAENGMTIADDTETVTTVVTSSSSSSSCVEEGEESVATAISYDLYKKFWGLQSYFTSSDKGKESMAAWHSLVSSTEAVLDTFSLAAQPTGSTHKNGNLAGDSTQQQARKRVKHAPVGVPLLDHKFDLEQLKNSSVRNHSDNGIEKAFFGCKFLTSSKLFELQLQDPELKQQICCQILFLIHFIRHRPWSPAIPPVSSASSSAASAQATAAATVGSTVVRLGAKSKPMGTATTTSTTATTTSITTTATSTATTSKPAEEATHSPEQNLKDMLKDMSALETRAYHLLEETDNGKDLVGVLRKLLRRESRWLKWKLYGCQPYELPACAATALTQPLVPPPPDKKKSVVCRPPVKRPAKSQYYYGITEADTRETARMLVSDVPTFDRHFEAFREAEDPDAGIEEEYHPKHDSVYCWRALRLLAVKKVSLFEPMSEGDKIKALKLLCVKPAADKTPRPIVADTDCTAPATVSALAVSATVIAEVVVAPATENVTFGDDLISAQTQAMPESHTVTTADAPVNSSANTDESMMTTDNSSDAASTAIVTALPVNSPDSVTTATATVTVTLDAGVSAAVDHNTEQSQLQQPKLDDSALTVVVENVTDISDAMQVADANAI